MDGETSEDSELVVTHAYFRFQGVATSGFHRCKGDFYEPASSEMPTHFFQAFLPVWINHPDGPQLEVLLAYLPGIGKVRAKQIAALRMEQGKVESIKEFVKDLGNTRFKGRLFGSPRAKLLERFLYG